MQAYEDQRWREAADLLHLDLWSSRGKKVKNAVGKRSHAMRGTIDRHSVSARCGLHDADDKVVVIEVPLNRPLMLGFVYRVTAPRRDYRGRRIGGKHIDVLGVESERVRRMVADTESGMELSRLADRYGDLGWLEITDERVLAHLEFHTTEEGYAPLIRTAVKLAILVEAARREIDSAGWEKELSANLDAAAGALRLRMDRRRFRLSGQLRGMATSLRLEANDKYVINARIKLSKPLAYGSEISPRVGLWAKIARYIGLDRPSGDSIFDTAFRVKGSLRQRLSASLVQHLVALSKDGDVRVVSDAITYRTPRLTIDASQTLQRLAAIGEELQGRARRSPYRDAPS